MKRTIALLLAAVLLFAAALALSSCERKPAVPLGGDPAEAGNAARTGYALAEPVYPEFPQRPEMPGEEDQEALTAYLEAYDKYMDALSAMRSEHPDLTDGERSGLQAFAARSVPLVLEGREEENAIYSPLSLWSALAMLAQCADGNSRQQALDALGADSVDALQEDISRIWQALYTDDGQSSLILSNSIWLNSALEGNYVQETLDTLAKKYFAGAYAVPMGTGEADRAVTDWVKEQTNGLIGGDAPVVQTEAETLALLASSLYYKAAWQEEFHKEGTQEDVFTDAVGNETRVDFMRRVENGDFLRREGWQAARLGIQLGEMVFVLPDEGVAPEDLLREADFLSGLDFQGDGALWGEVQWSVPKFDVDSDLKLLDALERLGVTDLLDPERADLSALTDLDAYLSEAKQLARVKVDEEGVEAAAVTILAVKNFSLPPQPTEVCVMDLDRPFLFVIRTKDVPLFIGIVNQVQA